MAKKQSPNLPAGRIISADDEGLAAAFQRMGETLGRLGEGENPRDYVKRGPGIIEEHVSHIVELLKDADAFDVIELMRMRELPMFLEGYRESVEDNLPSAGELIALILLARGQRAPVYPPTSKTRPAGVVPDLHDRAAEILTLGSFTLLDSGERDKYGPLTALSASYVSHDLTVQFKQYLHVHDEINTALFASEHIGDLLVEALGFSYEDFLAVREAVAQVHGEKFFALRDATAAMFEQRDARANAPAFLAEARIALTSMMELPGSRATLSVEEIAPSADVDPARAQAVLDLFSLSFEETDALDVVRKFLSGDHPFRSASLVRDADGVYISTGKPIGTDCFRLVAEEALKRSAPKFKLYEKRRVTVSEELALQRLAALLGTSTTYTNLKYFRANPAVDVARLGPDAQNITSLAEQTEADGLFLVEDVAICVEVKAKSLSSAARRGNVQRLSADLRDTVGSATAQALRLEDHIRTNGGLWLEDRTWLDLSEIREIRSVTVFLDDFGPISTALDELVRADVIKSERFPWLITLHDLTIIAEVMDRPAEFLLYLRRRTESEVSLTFKAIDELDLFMLFLAGGLWVEPDPDRVSEEFLGVPRPTGKERRRYRESATPTRVMTHTDPLDAWVYYQEGSSAEDAPKPVFEAMPAVNDLVNFLQDGRKPGWFRFSADLLNLAKEGQDSVADMVQHLVRTTASDGLHHNSLMTFAGAWGYPTLFMGTKPKGMSDHEANRRLAIYGFTKKHQIKSDRALMVIFDEDQQVRSVRYDNSPPEENKELDDAAIEMGLIPAAVMGRPVPPSARRTTKRLNPGKKGKGKRGRS
ncbi:hypothetical protein J7E45_11365 [Microbacterium sp. ISL-59]|uniref:hypothetical protein n=1 Tax=Microbacterium sp. ISL-59 TaxID=2819159 RepID=UPI001BE72CC1|nr:hypothetical protein [Microbacterium sp. ISL-59]MBT2496208.1 hypothetical protein [Microbacterium sp. ISL-59]